MPVNAQKEITKLWRGLQGAQAEMGRTYYRWREATLELLGPQANALEVGLKAAEVMGKDVGKTFLPRLNWLKGEDAFMGMLANNLAGLWIQEGAIAKVEKGEKPGELLIRCTRDPQPTHAAFYGVPMEEVAQCKERFFQSILKDVSVFFNIELKIEMLKALPRGEGEYLMKLSKVN
jgi:hypothetical protein